MLIVIFALLAIPFRSYSQPLLIMVAIPFGIVGAVLGHFILGYDLSILSMFGLVALTGVVVSDTLITPSSITCATVAPGGTCVLTGTYTVTQADVNTGSISNTGTVTSPLCPAGGAGVCTTTIVTPVPQTAALTIDKTAGTPTGIPAVRQTERRCWCAARKCGSPGACRWT